MTGEEDDVAPPAGEGRPGGRRSRAGESAERAELSWEGRETRTGVVGGEQK